MPARWARFAGKGVIAAVAFAALSTAQAAGSNTPTSKGVAYRWVDEQGEVHYGDRIPPQYAQHESAVINKQGVEVKRVDAERSPEQVAEESRAQQEAFKQKQHDNFLLTTYTSVKDIESLRDERIDQLKGQRVAGEQYVDSLHARLNSLEARAMAFRPYSPKAGARRMPDDLAEDLVRTLNEMHTQTDSLAAKGTEEATLRTQFQVDIERYRELHKVVDPR